MNVSTDKPFKIVYSLSQFENFGYVFQSYAVQLDESGEPTLLSQYVSLKNLKEFASGANDTDFELVKLIESYQKNALLKKFNTRKVSTSVFFSRLLNPESEDEKQVRDYLTGYLQRINTRILAKAGEKLLFISSRDGDVTWKKINLMPEPVEVRFHLFRNETNSHYFPSLRYAGEKLDFQFRNALLITEEPAWLLLDDKLYHFDADFDGKKLKPFFNKKFIAIPRTMEEEYLKKFILPLLSIHKIYGKGYEIRQHEFPCIPVLSISEKQSNPQTDLFGNSLAQPASNILLVTLLFSYGPYRFPSGKERAPWHVNLDRDESGYVLHKVSREMDSEKSILGDLKKWGLKLGFGAMGIDRNELLAWLSENDQNLRSRGIQVDQAVNNRQIYFIGTPSIELSIQEKEDTDWFDIRMIVHFGEYKIPFVRLRKYILQNKREFILPNGHIAVIPESWFGNYSELLQLVDTNERGDLRLKKHHLMLVDSLERDSLASVVISRRLEKLKNFEKIGSYELPSGLNGVLRPYQKSGYDWLRFLNEYQLGGCLADDMGLGKTVQTLTLLLSQKVEGLQRPSLLIMPVSLLFNWAAEAEKFAPSLKVLIYSGTQREKNTSRFGEYDLILTSYGIARLDCDLLKTLRFHYIILDESQAIKNPGSLTTQAVQQLSSRHRLILTGTPLENNTLDLWSQMSFINPGLLGSKSFFQRHYLVPIEKNRDEKAVQRLYTLIKPFILRRHKSQVAKFLPEKTENIHYSTMSEEQEKIYKNTKSKFRNLILEKIDSNGLSGSQIVLLQGLSQLRQQANHPRMTDPDYSGDSGKFDDVYHSIKTVISEENKVLVFSSFVKHLTLFREKFDSENIPYAYLDGSTIRRAEEIEKFQKDPAVNIFLISIKAGGLGLNLTAAGYVFLLDPWWNPAVEAQAIDRSHRIGQDKPVFIYRFITKNSIEEKIIQLQNRKRALADELISTEESFVKSLTREDILALVD